MLQYSFIDEFSNETKPSKLQDYAPYLVLYHLPDDRGKGMFVVTGGELKQWLEQAEGFPGKISARWDTIGWCEFESIEAYFACMAVYANSKFAQQVKNIMLSLDQTPLSPEGFDRWNTWVNDKERGILWDRKWDTTFVQQSDQDFWKSCGGYQLVMEHDGNPSMEEMNDSAPKRWLPFENGNIPVPWYAENFLTKERVYYTNYSTLQWSVIRDGNVCSHYGHWELHEGFLTEAFARTIQPVLKDGYEVVELKSIQWNNELIWHVDG